MIRLQDNTPKTYYERSRDFQFIGRLYDVVLNSVKTNADIIANGIPYSDFSPEKFLELLSRTLGFKPKHNYTHNQLLAICNIFSTILKNKGNIKAVELVGEAILKTEGILGTIACLMKYDAYKQKDLPVLRIIIPEKLAEIALFYDLLEYIIPAGCACEVVRGEMSDPILAETAIVSEDNVVIVKTAEGKNSTYRLDGNTLSQLAFYKQHPVPVLNPIITDESRVGKTEGSGDSAYNYEKENNTKTIQQNHMAASVVWRRGTNYKKGNNK